MRTWVVAIVAAVMVTGCGQQRESFTCTDDTSCSGGSCLAGFCSFASTMCPSGRQYGGLGGPSGGCVEIDAGMPPDVRLPDAGPVCFGSAPNTICFATRPTGSLEVAAPTTFDTVSGTVAGTQLTCATPMSGGTGYCVIAANTITVSSTLRATGTKPLVFVAADSISVPASINVGSQRTPTESIGAGADPATGCNAGTPAAPGATSGGGAGGSFMGAGANGGNGGGAGGGNGGVHGTAPGIGTSIHGGCPGQDGAGGGKGAHGHGGGAVFMIAGNTITVGATINAGGEGGAGASGMDSGGGGGGAGGMIGFDAPNIMVTGTLIANGGGGAEGSGNAANGNPGGDATSTNPALGGAAGSSGGEGGNGSAGAANGPGMPGVDGGSGGGGGGGGAGLIKGPPAALGVSVSPAATP
jgi:hypothetical protein